MLVVKVNPDRGIESALKTFKVKVQRTKMVQELKERSEFVKPSVKRRKEKLKAIYIQNLRNEEES